MTGQDLSLLLPLVDAVYAPVSDPAAAEAALVATAGEDAPDFVPVTGTAEASGSWYLA